MTHTSLRGWPSERAVNRLGLLFVAAVALAVAAKAAEQLFPQTVGGAAAAGGLGTALSAALYSGIGVALLVLAAAGPLGPRRLRLALALGLLVATLPPVLQAAAGGRYGVDSAAHTRYAAGLVLQGRHPYRDFDVQEAYERYPVTPNAITYHTDGTMLASYSYPAGAFLAAVPFQAVGVDIRWLYALAGVALLGMVAWLAPPGIATLALGYASLHGFLSLWTANAGVGEPLWTLLVVLAWVTRHHGGRSALLMGVALTVKQLSWFFFPFYLVAHYQQGGLRAAARTAVIAGAVFAVTNLPFLATDPRGWFEGVMGPMLFPLPVMGFGPARLGALVLPEVPKAVYTGLEVAALVGALALFYRWGRALPELAMVLPWVPLWLAWRSLSSYFYMVPLMVLIALFVRLRSAQPSPATEAPQPSVPRLAERVALMCIAAVVMSVGFWYESGLLWDELVANQAGHSGRVGLAAVGVLLSGCAIGIILMVAVGAIRPWVRVFAVFSALVALGLVTAASVHAIPTYQVDTAAAVHRGAELLLAGKHPYGDFDLPEAAASHGVPQTYVTTYRDGSPMRELAYPAGSFLAVAPLLALGVDDVRLLNGLAQLAIVLVLFAVAPPAYKLLALALPMSLHLLSFISVGQGYNEPVWALLLLAAWLARGRPLASGVALGAALAVKQIVWFFGPFWAIALWHAQGWRAAARASAVAAAVFAAANAPFALADPGLWVRSVFAPMSASLPAMGFGPSQLGARLLGPESAVLFTAAEALVGAACLAAFLRWGRARPELALILPLVPLWFAWRTIFSYYYLLPLLMAAAILLRVRGGARLATAVEPPEAAPAARPAAA